MSTLAMNTSERAHADLAEQRLEQFARTPDERHALLILARARRLADEHQLGVGVAGAEHDRLARRRELGAARRSSRACAKFSFSASRRSDADRSRS